MDETEVELAFAHSLFSKGTPEIIREEAKTLTKSSICLFLIFAVSMLTMIYSLPDTSSSEEKKRMFVFLETSLAKELGKIFLAAEVNSKPERVHEPLIMRNCWFAYMVLTVIQVVSFVFFVFASGGSTDGTVAEWYLHAFRMVFIITFWVIIAALVIAYCYLG